MRPWKIRKKDKKYSYNNNTITWAYSWLTSIGIPTHFHKDLDLKDHCKDFHKLVNHFFSKLINYEKEIIFLGKRWLAWWIWRTRWVFTRRILYWFTYSCKGYLWSSFRYIIIIIYISWLIDCYIISIILLNFFIFLNIDWQWWIWRTRSFRKSTNRGKELN
jgi:hypothetical protein